MKKAELDPEVALQEHHHPWFAAMVLGLFAWLSRPLRNLATDFWVVLLFPFALLMILGFTVMLIAYASVVGFRDFCGSVIAYWRSR